MIARSPKGDLGNETKQRTVKNTSRKRGVFVLCYNLFVLDTNTIKRVGILRGGMGEGYQASLDRGAELIAHIAQNLSHKYKVIDVFVDRDGVWHLGGLPVNPADVCHKVDVIWNVADHELSLTIKKFSIPCISPSAFAQSIEKNDSFFREHLNNIEVKMPRRMVLPLYQENFDGPRDLYAIKKAKEVHAKFGAPWIVKSFTVDKTMGIHLAKTFPELVNAIEDGVNHKKSILVEEFIEGKIASLHTLRNFRNEDLYTFPLGNTYGVFTEGEKKELESIARKLHQHLGAGEYLKSDFVLTPRRKIYLLGINLHPDLKPKSHFSEVVEQVGAKVHHLVDHILSRVS